MCATHLLCLAHTLVNNYRDGMLLQVQLWKATVFLTPVFGGFLADAYLGHFVVILIFSIIYFVVRDDADQAAVYH